MIGAYTGLCGYGKTLSMTHDVYNHWLETKLPVYTNYPVRFPTGRLFQFPKNFIPELGKDYSKFNAKIPEYYYPKILRGDNFLEFFKVAKECIIAIDEAGTILDARSWHKFPKWLMAKFRESRHSKLHIYYTAQAINDVDSKLRQLTNFWTQCKFEKISIKRKNKEPFVIDLLLRNWTYHSNVITAPTEANKKEYLESFVTYFPWEFRKVYKMYDTHEDSQFEVENMENYRPIFINNKFENMP
jgi:hypothetical protein